MSEAIHRQTGKKERRDELLDEAGCVPEGRRDLDLELGQDVRYLSELYRLSWPQKYVHERPDGFSGMLRLWRRQELMTPESGIVVGQRTLQSGKYIPDTSTPNTPLGPASYSPASFEVWRTHRVYLVTDSIRKNPVKVLSDDIMGVRDE